MKLPKHIFFTGVPGSKWSSIAQAIESSPAMNTSDRTVDREYTHHAYSGHKGAYFGRGMELEAKLDLAYIDSAWENPRGCKLVKSHDWAYCLPLIKEAFPDAWIMMVYRPDMASFAWWHEAGGFQIKYPCYDAYKNSTTMLAEISAQNSAILEYSIVNNATWSGFTSEWLRQHFGIRQNIITEDNILVTLLS